MELSFTTEILGAESYQIEMPPPRQRKTPTLEPPEYPGRRVLEAYQYGPALWMRAEVIEQDAVDGLPSYLRGRPLWYRYEFITHLRQWNVAYLGSTRPEFTERSIDDIASMLDNLDASDLSPNEKTSKYCSLLESLVWHQEPRVAELERKALIARAVCQQQVENSMYVTMKALATAAAKGVVLSQAQEDEYRRLADYFSRDH